MSKYLLSIHYINIHMFKGFVYIWIVSIVEWISYVFTSHDYISYMEFCNTIWTYSKYIYICINTYICLCVKMSLTELYLFIYTFQKYFIRNYFDNDNSVQWKTDIMTIYKSTKKNSLPFFFFIKEQKLSSKLCVCVYMHVCMMPLFHIWFVTLLFKLHWLKPCSSIIHGSPIRRVWIGGVCNISNHKLH